MKRRISICIFVALGWFSTSQLGRTDGAPNNPCTPNWGDPEIQTDITPNPGAGSVGFSPALGTTFCSGSNAMVTASLSDANPKDYFSPGTYTQKDSTGCKEDKTSPFSIDDATVSWTCSDGTSGQGASATINATGDFDVTFTISGTTYDPAGTYTTTVQGSYSADFVSADGTDHYSTPAINPAPSSDDNLTIVAGFNTTYHVGDPIDMQVNYPSVTDGTSTQTDQSGCNRGDLTSPVTGTQTFSWSVTGIAASPSQGTLKPGDDIKFTIQSTGSATVTVSGSWGYDGGNTTPYTSGNSSFEVQDTPQPPILPSFSLDDAAGPKYRKIALNGGILSDEKPQATDETDEDKEETFVDAFTDTLHHSTTDVYVPLPGGLLALSVRRNVTAEIWGEQTGRDPQDATYPRPDRPFGYCWSSNLGAGVEMIVYSATSPSASVPVPVINVTDENGDVHRFRTVTIGTGAAAHDIYYPYPQSYEEKDEYLNSLVANSDGSLTFTRQFGTVMQFQPITYTYADSTSSDSNPQNASAEVHTFYRAQFVKDRFGNQLDYSYSSSPNNSLIPSQITFHGHSQQNIQIFFDANGHVTSVTDPVGNKHVYSYLAQTVSGQLNCNTTNYVLQTVQGPAYASGVVPTTTYTYTSVTEPDYQPFDPPTDTSLRNQKYHVDLGSICDPNQKTYAFSYGFDTSRLAGKSLVSDPVGTQTIYPTNGNPRLVTNITLPDGLGQTSINKVSLIKISGTTFSNSTFAGPHSTLVKDAAGNARIYSFTNPQYILLNDFKYIRNNLECEIPHLASYNTTTISYFQGNRVGLTPLSYSNLPDGATPVAYTLSGATQLLGNETFTFDSASGFALSSITDFSGNTTTYEHDDTWSVPQNSTAYAGADALGFPVAKYAEPNKEFDAQQIPKIFHYTSFGANAANRVMDKVIDRDGRETKYFIDSTYGLPQKEIIYTDSTESTAVQETDYTYDTTFPSFVRSKIICNLGKPTDTPNLEIDYAPDDFGRVAQEIVDPNGLSLMTKYGYDLNNNKTSVQDPRRYTTSFHYDGLNHLMEVDYPSTNGGTSAFKKFQYDPRGNKVAEIDENGHATLYAYDGLNRIVQEARDMNGNMVIDPNIDLITSYTYNGLNSKTSVTDPNTHTSYMGYDALQRLTSTTDALKKTTTYSYGANSGGDTFDVSTFKPTQITGPRTYVATMTYDNRYRMTNKSVQYQLAPPAYSNTRMQYDNVGNILKSWDPVTNETDFQYDALNRVTLTTFADQTTKTTIYSSTGVKVRELDELSSTDSNRVTDMVYDGAGRLTDVIGGTVNDGKGNMVRPDTHTDYDADGNVADTINPLTKEWIYSYDPRNRKTGETQPAVLYQGAMIIPTLGWSYDDAGNVLSTTDARTKVTNYCYDVANRKTDVYQPAVTLPNGQAVHPRTHTDYDLAGNIVGVTDANTHLTVNVYDAMNRLKTTTDASGVQVAYGYDEVGNRTSVADASGQTILGYDGLNRNTSTEDNTHNTTKINYNGLNKVSRIDALSRETDYGYDQRNRLTSITYVNRSGDNRSYGYDWVGNLLSVTEAGQPATNVAYQYDALNRVKYETSNGINHAYLYDLAGNRLQAIYGPPGVAVTNLTPQTGQRTITSAYDNLNRLSSMVDQTAAEYTANSPGRTTGYAYDQNGNITQKTAPNGDVETIGYDAINRDVSQTATHGTGSLYTFNYAYDAVGNLARDQESYPSGLNNRTVVNFYELDNRLHSEAVSGATSNVTTTYGYDGANNRKTKIVATTTGTTTVTGTTSYNYDSVNQLTDYSDGTRSVTLTYDLDGNRASRSVSGGSDNGTDTYSYDFDNRLVGLVKGTAGASTGTYTYAYDYRTRRVTRDESQAGGVATHVIFSGGTSVQEYDGTNTTPTVEYIRGSDYGGGVGGILYTLRGGNPSYTHENRRGDVVAKTDGSGSLTYQAQYEAFGNQVATSGATLDRQKSNSKDTDPTNLVDEGFRYRDLETGAFITRDPAGFVDGPNLYTYVVQNPWTSFDPEGLQVEPTGEMPLPDPDNPSEDAEIACLMQMQMDAQRAAAGAKSSSSSASSAGNGKGAATTPGPPVSPPAANTTAPNADGTPAAPKSGNNTGIGTSNPGSNDAKSVAQDNGTTANGGPKATKPGVQPYQTGTYKDMKNQSLPKDGLSLDHQPSYASLVEQFRQQNGRDPTPQEAKEIYNNGMVMAVPDAKHISASPTYGGRNNKDLQKQDAANPQVAATRDSQAQVQAAAPEHKEAAQKGAQEIQNAAAGSN